MTDKDVPAAPAPADTGITCLVMLARLFNIAACPEQLRHEFADDGRLFGVQELLLAAGSLGLEARRIRCSATRLDRTPLPAIAVGDSVARVRELENIRSFLTGNCLTVVLDVVFSVVFLVVMAMYSLQLTALVVLRPAWRCARKSSPISVG